MAPGFRELLHIWETEIVFQESPLWRWKLFHMIKCCTAFLEHWSHCQSSDGMFVRGRILDYTWHEKHLATDYNFLSFYHARFLDPPRHISRLPRLVSRTRLNTYTRTKQNKLSFHAAGSPSNCYSGINLRFHTFSHFPKPRSVPPKSH